jgi:hypothetical protein
VAESAENATSRAHELLRTLRSALACQDITPISSETLRQIILKATPSPVHKLGVPHPYRSSIAGRVGEHAQWRLETRIGLISPVIHENRIIGRGSPRFLGQCRLSYCSERLGGALCQASNLTDPAPPRGALNRGEISLRRLSLSLRAAFLESSGHSRRPMRRPLRLRTQRQFQLLSGTPIVRRNTPR